MLDHPNIKVMLNTDYRELLDFIPYKSIVYTGPVDEFFDYKYGKLPIVRSTSNTKRTRRSIRRRPLSTIRTTTPTRASPSSNT
jgi:UDP-galactopyranose mutase